MLRKTNKIKVSEVELGELFTLRLLFIVFEIFSHFFLLFSAKVYSDAFVFLTSENICIFACCSICALNMCFFPSPECNCGFFMVICSNFVFKFSAEVIFFLAPSVTNISDRLFRNS